MFTAQVIRAFKNIAVDNAPNTLLWLHAFTLVLSLPEPCCRSPALHCVRCHVHGDQHPTRVQRDFPLTLEHAFCADLSHVQPSDQLFWYQFNLTRLDWSLHTLSSEQYLIRDYYRAKSQFTAAIADHLDYTNHLEAIGAPTDMLQKSLQVMVHVDAGRLDQLDGFRDGPGVSQVFVGN
eukprot:m.9604 g.9604  ORF g.9604 m.9604 type:complete len:178 (-) comp9458_c0_seq2:233-766(-)